MAPVLVGLLPLEQLWVIPGGCLLVFLGWLLIRLRRTRLEAEAAMANPEPAPEAVITPAGDEEAAPTEAPAAAGRGARLGLMALICGPVAGMALGLVAFMDDEGAFGYRFTNALSMVILGVLAGVLGGATFGVVAGLRIWIARRSRRVLEPISEEPPRPS